MWLNGLKFIIVSHYFAKFQGHKPCGSDTAAKMFHVTLQDHVIKESGDFMKGNSSLYLNTLSKLTVIDIVLMDIQLFLVCQVILQNHMIK